MDEIRNEIKFLVLNLKKKPRKANSRVFPKFSLEVLQTSFYGNL